MINEGQLEQLAIQWFQDTGWSYANGPDIAPEGWATDFNDLLAEALRRFLESHEPSLTESLRCTAVLPMPNAPGRRHSLQR